VADGYTINIGGRYYHDATDDDGWQAAAQLIKDLTEEITLTGEIGAFVSDAPTTIGYGSAGVVWNPGGGFETSVKGSAYSNGAYKAAFSITKSYGE
jgi:hypothetical protein